jgi:hypothetical protein
MGHFEVAMGASTNGVDYSFGNSFSIKLSKFINKMNILKEKGTSGSCG